MRSSRTALSLLVATLSLSYAVDAEFVDRSAPRLNAPQQRHRQASSSIDCGDNLTCLNGGSCMEGHLEHYGNNSKPLCNCKSAIVMEDDPNDPGNLKAVQYVGVTCNIKVDHHHYCGGDADLFCINGGKCRTQANDYERNPCRCNENYAGRHCEYLASEVEACDLTCNGHGRCEHGHNPHAIDNSADSMLDMWNGGVQGYQYCVCDPGFAGSNCEYEVRHTKKIHKQPISQPTVLCDFLTPSSSFLLSPAVLFRYLVHQMSGCPQTLLLSRIDLCFGCLWKESV